MRARHPFEPQHAHVHDDLVRLAQRQCGLLTTEQIGARVLGDQWLEVLPSVFAPAVLTLDRQAMLVAIRLSLDARQSRTGAPWTFAGPTAAELLRLKVPAGQPPTVVVEGSSCPPMPGVRVGFARKLPPRRLIELAPVLAVPLVIIQCASMLPRDDVVTLVEHTVRQKRCTLEQLRACCRRGVAGSAVLRSVVEELSEGTDRWARVLLRLLVAAGLPRPETERGVPGDAPRIYLDLCWWWLRLAIEVDDWASHASREASERDRDRDRWLMSDYGVTVLRVTPRQIRDQPQKVVRDIVAAYRRAERRSAPPAA